MSMAPRHRAGPLRCADELCSMRIGVAFSWSDMLSCFATSFASILLYTFRILASVMSDMACAWTPNTSRSSATLRTDESIISSGTSAAVSTSVISIKSTDWGLTALSAQIGNVMPSKCMLQFLKIEINKKMLHVENTLRKLKPLQ